MDLLTSLLSDTELRHRLFPITKSRIFMAHAAVTVLPGPVAEAMSALIQRCSEEFRDFSETLALIQRTRESAARLINASPDEIALLGPTSLGLSLVANGITWAPGDEVVCYLDDYPANVYPWMNLRDKGVQIRFIEPAHVGELTVEALQRVLTPKTKLVALASCSFLSGFRVDIAAIGQLLRERGILFCMDAIQTLGAFPTTVEHVDFLAADAHKWLLGPCAAGLMYVRQPLQEKLRPPVYGWNNVRSPNFVAQEQIVFRSNAHRFEAGTHNLLGIVGLVAAMELILEIGVENIAAELLRKRAWLVPALQAKGYQVLAANLGPEAASGIISFHGPGDADISALHQKLEAANIITSLRTDRKGRRYLRLSP